MSSRADAKDAFVWIWLPEATEPVVAGRLDQDGERLLFAYGTSYRSRKNAIPIYQPELHLQQGVIAPVNGFRMASCIRDGSPDAWGRRVIINRLTGTNPDAAGVPEISEITFLLQSGSERISALDFQASPTEYVPALPHKHRSKTSWKQLPSSRRASLSPRRSMRRSSTAPQSAARAPRRLSMTAKGNSSPNFRRPTTPTAL